MGTFNLRILPRAKWLLVVVALGLFLRGGYYGGLLVTVCLFFTGWSRFGESPRALMKATAISWKWTVLLIVVFALVLIGAGHGVMPVGVILVLGWERFLVPVGLGWLGIALVGVSPFLRWSFAPSLALVGVLLLLAACVLFQMRAEDPQLAVLLSLPFLGCLVVYTIHLSRVRLPGKNASAEGSDQRVAGQSP